MRKIYFLGIGGIGMSALARYFLHEGCAVAGYDRTPTPLTARLESEGAAVNYDDNIEAIPEQFRDKDTLVVYTPAVPSDHPQMQYFREGGYRMLKRSQMLGELSVGKFVMAVAGTHGKTTTSTLVSWLNHAAAGEGSAFLGGVSKNFDSNLVLGHGGRLAVEADEFDRSFLQLNPNVAVVTSADADHLDIYGTHEAVKEAFSQFIDRICAGGSLVIKRGVDVAIRNSEISVYSYSFDQQADFYATNITLLPTGHYTFDVVTPFGTIEGCTLGIPGWVNVENAVAAVALFILAAKAEGKEVDYNALRGALASFSGVKRRFEFYVNTPKAVYMDDYAHHPRELSAAITSVKRMFPERKLTAIFQPHLYTRTRDLYEEFAQALSLADQVVLLPIYPARELPIEGICSQIIADRVTVPCAIVEREGLALWLADADTDIVVTFGAGNIDAYCSAVAEVIEAKSR
jgi:UDP-N-acetylmuramate--alanine ligase